MRTLSCRWVAFISIILIGCNTTEPEQTFPLESYKHVRPAWSPDGRSVAFTATVNDVFGIYAVDTSGANLRLLHTGDALGASWSPNGQYIAYSQQTMIYRVPITQDVPELLVSQVPSIRPAWSPDGASLAYARDGLRIIRVSSGEDVSLFHYGTSPSWRPDGASVLAYDVRPDAGSGSPRYSVFMVSVDSSVFSEVYVLYTHDDCAFFSMSPDGLHIVFSRKPEGELAGIRRISLGSRTEIGLTTDGGDYPSISPDGEWIAYTRTAPDDGGLWIMRMDGSEKRRVTSP